MTPLGTVIFAVRTLARRRRLLSAIVLVACSRSKTLQPGDAARSEWLTPAPSASIPAADSTLVDAAVDAPSNCAPAAAAPVQPKVLKLTEIAHGIDGLVDVFEIGLDDQNGERDRLVVRLRPKVGPPQQVAFKGLERLAEPTLTSVRFGDAAHSSVVVRYQERGATWARWDDVVLDIVDAKLIRAVAIHVADGKSTRVEVSTLLSGASNGGGVVHPSDCGFELLSVGCEAWWPAIKKRPERCSSTNSVYFVRGARWYWNTHESDSCVPFGLGHCSVQHPFPDRSKFPPAVAP